MVDALDLEEFLANQDARDIAQSVNHDIGEALSQLVNSFPEYVNRISNYQQIIGSRNVMSHELFGRDYELLWRNFEDGAPILLVEVEALLSELNKPSTALE